MNGVAGSAGSGGAARIAEELPGSWPLQGSRPLRRTDLHGSISDPILDTMNFLNEITLRYPDAEPRRSSAETVDPAVRPCSLTSAW